MQLGSITKPLAQRAYLTSWREYPADYVPYGINLDGPRRCGRRRVEGGGGDGIMDGQLKGLGPEILTYGRQHRQHHESHQHALRDSPHSPSVLSG
ncbi:hypothetical protein GWI33_006521 [Rhynchophorus ferrugineus]|uniref:Uncharacterized protein n=1 Tax=Rhynchophorus ferrugineus TaxID=354439 RepID=A0A834MHA1_RHYFE|nr:hypothetical protein GWI33_006521 [Rhynchophorus ferrugineus]